jgi:prevent-host-death family protein
MTKATGIRELKAHLSKYVRDVKRGDEIIISERGKAVARIVPISPTSERSRLQALQRLASEGKIILPTNMDKPKKPSSRKKAAGSLFSDAVLEDRR